MSIILAYIVGIIILVIIAKLLSAPIKLIWKLLVNALLGGLGLWLFNLISGVLNFGVTIDINFISALITGFLGVPGVILLLLLKILHIF